MRAINVFLSIAISLLIGAAVLEGGLRLIGRGPAKTLNQFDAELGWSKEPGAHVARHGKGFRATFEINERGLRDDAMESTAKPAGRTRVLALGDSFTLGYTVEREDLFVDLLERRWRDEGRDVDVINAGTEGYATDQEVLWLATHGKEYAPDLVLLFPYENDLFWNGEEQYLRFPKPRYSPEGTLEPRTLVDPGPKAITDRWALARLFRRFFPKGPELPRFTVEGVRGSLSNEFAPLLLAPPEFVPNALARTRGALIALRREADALGAKLVVVPIPSNAAIDEAFAERFGQHAWGLAGLARSAWSPDRPVDLFLDSCRELEIDAIDVRAQLRAEHAAGKKLYLDLFEEAEWHFAPQGNRAFAEAIAAGLDQRGLLPAAEHGEAFPPVATAEAGVPIWIVVFGVLWAALSIGYASTYPDEPRWQAPLKVGALLAVVFTLIVGGGRLVSMIPPPYSAYVLAAAVAGILGFVLYKLGGRILTVLELLKAFVLRGHWYLMPLVVVLLSIGSLLVVAASSPFVAPFIYTLF